MIRRLFLLVGSVLSAACSEPPRPGIPPQHVMLVSVAGLRADHVSAYQYARPTTLTVVSPEARRTQRAFSPDGLAADGVLFAQAFAPSNDLEASLFSLLYGQRAHLNGAPATAPVGLAQALADGGFDVAGFATGTDERARLAPGFAAFALTESDDATIAKALQWVTQRDFGDGRSTLLWIHLEGPRFPFEPGVGPGRNQKQVDYEAKFVDPTYSGAADGTLAFRASQPELDWKDEARIVAAYDGEIVRTKFLLEYFLEYFTYQTGRSNAWSRTLVVYCGVGGLELFREPGEWGEPSTLHDSTLRVPLIVRHPDSLTGRRIFGDVVELRDVAPTILDWFDLPVPQTWDGRSLLARTDSYIERPFPERPAVARSADGKSYSVRSRDWRLIVHESAAGREVELYHVRFDPHELANVAAEEAQVVDELEGILEAWRNGDRSP